MDNPGYTGPSGPARQMQEEAHSTKGVEVADCATGFLKLRFLNMFRSPKWFLVFLSLAACVQGLCINGLVNVVITSIELRFGLKSAQTGVVVACQDIGSLLVMIPASYYGGRLGASKPRWIAAGLLVMGIGSFLWTVPHFTTGPYTGGEAGEEKGSLLCSAGGRGEECGEEGEQEVGLADYRYVFFVAQLLHGIGCSPLISLGTTFLDQSVSKRSSPLYMAVFQTWFVLGPALGYMIGGELLLLHTDLVADSGLTPASSLWVGAWWPGFFLSGCLAVFCALVIHLYPASINRKRDTTVQEAGALPEAGLLSMLRSLLTNPTFLLVSLGGLGDGAIISGLAAFLPKFIEQQYGLSNGLSAQIVGLIVVPAGGLGTFLGGWAIKKFNLTRNGIIAWCIVSGTIFLPMTAQFLLSCPGPTYAGITTTATVTTVNSDCRSACNCPSMNYDPVCGSNSQMYLSPCHAGCTATSSSNNFTDCACADGGSAFREICPTECDFLVPFIVIAFLMVFVVFSAMMPTVVAGLRAVEESERPLAVGLQTCIMRVAGGIPGPIAFGYFLDKTCTLWDSDCDGGGSCLAYDNWRMGVSLIYVCLIFRGISVLLFSLGLWSSRNSRVGTQGVD